MIDCPRALAMRSATMRAIASEEPPAPNGTIMVMAFAGYCAAAVLALATAISRPVVSCGKNEFIGLLREDIFQPPIEPPRRAKYRQSCDGAHKGKQGGVRGKVGGPA